MSNEELVLLIQADVEKADNLYALYQQNSGLIHKICKRFSRLTDPEDLQQEAFLAVEAAAEIWTPDGGATFSTFLYSTLVNMIGRYARKAASPFHVPEKVAALVAAYKTAVKQYEITSGRRPSEEELQVLLGINEKQLRAVILAADQEQIWSLEEGIPGTEGETFGDIIADPNSNIDELEERIQRQQISQEVRQLLDHLPDREKQVLQMRYFEDRSLAECAAVLGVSPSTVRNIQQRALKKLRPFASRESAADVYSLAVKGIGFQSFRHTLTSSTERVALELIKHEEKM